MHSCICALDSQSQLFLNNYFGGRVRGASALAAAGVLCSRTSRHARANPTPRHMPQNARGALPLLQHAGFQDDSGIVRRHALFEPHVLISMVDRLDKQVAI